MPVPPEGWILTAGQPVCSWVLGVGVRQQVGALHAGLAFDMAIRLYLESFRLPGEAQKINRIMESFGKHYHEQCPDLFRNADAVYILGYSVILLNTDQHNVGVGALTRYLEQSHEENLLRLGDTVCCCRCHRIKEKCADVVVLMKGVHARRSSAPA